MCTYHYRFTLRDNRSIGYIIWAGYRIISKCSADPLLSLFLKNQLNSVQTSGLRVEFLLPRKVGVNLVCDPPFSCDHVVVGPAIVYSDKKIFNLPSLRPSTAVVAVVQSDVHHTRYHRLHRYVSETSRAFGDRRTDVCCSPEEGKGTTCKNHT